MSATRYFPLDIKSAKMYGIKRWQKEFFWPVSYQSYMQMETEIKQALNEFIEGNIDKELSELLLINYKIFFDYSNLLHSIWVLKILDKDGFKPLYGDDSINFKGIMEKGIPLRSVLGAPVIQRENAVKMLRRQAWLIKATMSFNKSITSLLRSVIGQTPFVAIYSSLNSLAREYILTHLNEGIVLKESQDWYPRDNDMKLSQNQQEQIHLLSKDLVQRVNKIAISRDLTLTELQLSYLHKITLELFQATMMCLDALKKHVSTLKPLHLLIGSAGNHFSRMLSVAIRNNGGTVTGFMHGEPVIYLWDKYSWLELSTIDRFITYTEHSAKMLESLLNVYPPLRANQVMIVGAETRKFYDLWQKESEKPLPKKIESVMLVAKGFEHDNKIGHGISFPELMQLEWDLRIIDCLKKAGYKVIYKKHPDGKLRGCAIDFLDSDVEIVYDRFETVMDYADACLFNDTRSTTFGTALCSNKPIIYIDGGWEEWIPEMRDLFAKRCTIVPAHFDERNRLIINEEELLEALAHKPTEPNTEFIKKYLLPEGVKA